MGSQAPSYSACIIDPVTTQHYIQTQELGKGTFGVVVKAVDLRSSPPTDVAIKLIPRGEFVKNYKTYLKREIENQSGLRHPLIVALKEVLLLPKHMAIVMEYAAGGDLFNYVLRNGPACRLTEHQARWMFQQLIIGLDYSHRRGVANRDLKLENLLLDRDGRDGTRPLLKICDFGFSKADIGSAAKTGVGTPVYMAPEVLLGDVAYDAKAADVWSCGVILYAMIFGKYPFDAMDPQFHRRLADADYSMPLDVEVSRLCLDILTQLLVVDPAKRMTLAEIKQHPWFLLGLPSGALAMNDCCINAQPPDPLRLRAQIDQIVEFAQRPGQQNDPCWSITL